MLITLGIIDIVAALTMPALVANYQKKVFETRIKKFYNGVENARRAKIGIDGAFDKSMLNTVYSAEQVEQYWDVNFAPYLKTTYIEKLNRGVAVGFFDGSGLYLYNGGNGTSVTNVYTFWCVDAKNCKNIDETKVPNSLGDGKNILVTNADASFKGNNFSGYVRDEGREGLLTRCTNNPINRDSLCSGLIMYDGWEIKDDYPWW